MTFYYRYCFVCQWLMAKTNLMQDLACECGWVWSRKEKVWERVRRCSGLKPNLDRER